MENDLAVGLLPHSLPGQKKKFGFKPYKPRNRNIRLSKMLLDTNRNLYWTSIATTP
jgi:hypothetical protein